MLINPLVTRTLLTHERERLLWLLIINIFAGKKVLLSFLNTGRN